MTYGVIDTLAVDAAGNILVGEQVEILVGETSTRATIYSDQGVTPISNPLTTGEDGRVVCYVSPGTYNVRSTRAGASDKLQTIPSLVQTDFGSHSAFVTWAAANTAGDGTVVKVNSGGAVVQFEADAAFTAANYPGVTFGANGFQTGWRPAGVKVSPAHCGAHPGNTTDYAAQINAAASLVRASWNGDNYDFILDGDHHTFRADSSIDLTNSREGAPTVIQNMTLHSAAAGKIALDFALTNIPTIKNVHLFGDRTTPPRVGVYVGRALLGSGYPAAANASFHNFTTGGDFEWADVVNFASEVSCWSGTNLLNNRSRSTSSVSYVGVDNMQTIQDHLGAVLTSDFQSLPTTASGNHSNVNHTFGQLRAYRNSDVQLTITGISQANPAVVTVSSGTLAGANLSNGDKVFITGGDMTEVKYRVFTVANIDTGADTFELSGEDATGHTAYTGGATLQNQTGANFLLAGAKSLSMDMAYPLTYGNRVFVIDRDNGGDIRNWKINAQFERQVDQPIEFIVTSGVGVASGLYFHLPNISQDSHTSVFKVTGAGQMRVDGGELVIENMATAPSSGVLDDPANYVLRAFDFEVPLEAAVSNVLSVTNYSGKITAHDRFPVVEYYGPSLSNVDRMTFGPAASGLTGVGIRQVPATGQMLTYDPIDGQERSVAIMAVSSTGALADAANAVNTTGKYIGKIARNTSTGALVYASGTAPTDAWLNMDGSTAHTPV